LLAVAQKLKATDPTIEVIYVGERGSKFASMTKGQAVFDRQYKVFAGKFRRYHGESWLTRLFDVKTNLRNFRDIFFVLFGIIESWLLLQKLQPDVILLKGGFVGVPIGLAARGRFPIVTHDSDALPGLANRLVSRWAVYHATGMPASYYKYPKDKIKYVGVIVTEAYQNVTKELMKQYRQQLKLPTDAEVLMITGGSGGAESINQVIAKIAPDLLAKMPKLQIIHQVGQGKEGVYGSYHNDRLQVYGLMPFDELYRYSGAADVIVTRAGANTIAEYGIQSKACIVVPNPLLTGGHQVKNAQFLTDKEAAVVVNEDHLPEAIDHLLAHPAECQKLGRRLHELMMPNAAAELAKILLKVAKRAGD